MRSVLTLLVVCALFTAHAQKTKAPVVKRSLSHDVYDGWKEITYRQLTPDGTVAAFTINPQEGDGKVVFYNLKNSAQDSVHRATDIALTWDSQFGIFKIKPQKLKVDSLRRAKKKKEDLPKDSLGILMFASRKLEKIADVRSFRVPEKAGGWLAYQLEAKKETKSAGKATPKVDSVRKIEKPKKIKKNTDDNGYTLMLRRLSDKKETSFGFVKDYAFAKYGQGLLFTTTGNDSTLLPGVYWYDLKTEQMKKIFEGHIKYKMKGLAISEDGTQASFLVDTDTTKALIRYFKLYHWKNTEATASLLADEKSSGIPASWMVSENRTPEFSKDGSKLFFGTAPKPVVQDTTRLPEEIISVEVWTWNDDYIYPQQNVQLENEKKRSYLMVAHLADRKLVQLATRENPDVQTGEEGNAAVALSESDVPYRKMSTWDVNVLSDVYVVDVATGSRKEIAHSVKASGTRLSPRANYIQWFSLPDTAWVVYDIKASASRMITKGMKVRFADEEDDHPDYPGDYGTAGWTANDESLLVYDRYDIWSFDPQGKRAPVNLTAIGRKQKIQFRYLRLDPEERFIDPTRDLLLSAFDETNKTLGYYKLSLKTNQLTKLLVTNHRYTGTVKARHADRLLFSRQSFTEYPDVWTADFTFTNMKKLSDANPQMKKYLWGSVELVKWTSLDGVPLQGLLYKPENFDPAKKYPMIVYFYEKSSDELYSHYVPYPSASTINRTVFASNGYLVFVPDIVYKVGFPGESAHNCILPGVTSLVAKGFVDEKNIGVQGQSWGGYQVAYLITRTNLFKAAGAGAPVANMTSAYGGIRWGTGISRMFQYEHSQSRIGGTLWEKPLYYIENSPLFFADKIQTPLFMTHNDADGAVPWYQGIEFYMALRRLEKPVWLLVYNKEDHNLRLRQNRKDLSVRLSQFFDHYLKGAPQPLWMKEGVPATEKGINQRFELSKE